jgi:hypothetical protein
MVVMMKKEYEERKHERKEDAIRKNFLRVITQRSCQYRDSTTAKHLERKGRGLIGVL